MRGRSHCRRQGARDDLSRFDRQRGRAARLNWPRPIATLPRSYVRLGTKSRPKTGRLRPETLRIFEEYP